MRAPPARRAARGVRFMKKAEGVQMPRDLAILACTECKRRNYTTTRNKRTMTERVEKVKYCPFDKKHTVHKEVK